MLTGATGELAAEEAEYHTAEVPVLAGATGVLDFGAAGELDAGATGELAGAELLHTAQLV